MGRVQPHSGSPCFVRDRWKMFLLNRATKRPQRPSEFLFLNSQGWSEQDRVDFDFSVELFDIWYEGRCDETVDEPARKPPKGTVKGAKYKTILERLGLDSKEADFAQDDTEEAIASAIATGEIDIEDLPDLLARHGSAEAVLRMVRTQ